MKKDIFVSRLKEARERKKITLKDLAEKCGVSLSAMNRYAALTSMPSFEVVANIADALDVSLDWLCGNKNVEETGIQIETCADVAIALDKITEKFEYATIDPNYTSGNSDYSYIEHFYVDVRIESKALHHYYTQIESTLRYLKELPQDMKDGFLPYKQAMEERLQKQLVSLPERESGFKFDLPF